MKLEEALKIEAGGESELFEIKWDYKALEYIYLLREKILHFNKEEDYSYLLEIFPKLSRELKLEENDKTLEKANDLMLEIRKEIQKHLASYEEEKKEDKNFIFLKTCVDNLESISLAYLYHFIEKYDGTTYHFLYSLIFDVRNLSLIKDAFTRYPYLVNSINEKDERLLFVVLEKWEEVLNKLLEDDENSILELHYYDEVMKILLKTEKLHFASKERKALLKKLKEKIVNVSNSKSPMKRKVVFWINDMLDKMYGKNPIITEEYLNYKYNIVSCFDEGILSESRRDLSFSKKNRRVVTDEYIIAIDDVDAEEIDDAISVKRLLDGSFLLGVHIADVNGALQTHPLIIEEAINRGTSIYLSDKTIGMLPEILGKEKLSLLAGKKRFANSFYMKVNPYGEVEDVYFEETIIELDKNVSYRECDRILKYGIVDDFRLLQTLENANELTGVLKDKLMIDSLYSYTARTNKNASNTAPVENYHSTKIVECAMVLANRELAKYFLKHNYPFVYRNHELDLELKESLEEIKKELEANKESRSISKFMNRLSVYPKAYYGTVNKGHDGLNLECYSHMTSPLRRAADILGTMCLKEFYFSKPEDKRAYELEDYLKEKCKEINTKCRLADEYLKVYEKNKRP